MSTVRKNTDKLIVLIGKDELLKLAELQSREVYVPSIKEIEKKNRNKRIRQDFTGDNHSELAQSYKLTETRIREILKKR